MNRIGTIILLSFISFIGNAQEYVQQLKGNAILQLQTPNHKESTSSSRGAADTIQMPGSRLSLPFIDDFSSNTLLTRDIRNISVDTFCANFLVDEKFVADSFEFMLSPSYAISFNVSDSTLDSVALTQVEVKIYEDTSNCLKASDSFMVWPTYYTYSFDTLTGNPTDSTPVARDSVLYSSQTPLFLILEDVNSLWLDNDAWINRTLAFRPPSVGVATLDGLDANGFPYSDQIGLSGPADQLTSKRINISSFLGSDSLYLSFYYQPEGYGDRPQASDSLVLELMGVDGKWYHAWSSGGSTFKVERPFKKVLISVSKPIFLHQDFQFRFRNYATLSGNNDHWHIDYVYLDQNRDNKDSLVDDVGVMITPRTMLKNYFAMPWNHFIDDYQSELTDDISMTIRNSSETEPRSVNYSMHTYLVEDGFTVGSRAQGTPLNANMNSEAEDDKEYKMDSAFITLPSPIKTDSVVLRNEYQLETFGDLIKQNDTVWFDQKFHNYMAYDDGSAERAYGVYGIEAQFAYQFNARVKDTLRAIQIHWAQMNFDVSQNLLDLRVWQSIDTVDELNDVIVYEMLNAYPSYVDSVNGFYTYIFDDEVEVDGDFYIGWMQEEEDLLNIGLDGHRIENDHMFYNTQGKWYQSIVQGAVMMRALLGSELPDWISVEEKDEELNHLSLYPNPASDRVYLNQIWDEVILVDIMGSIIYRGSNINSISLDVFLSGIYFVKTRNENEEWQQVKLSVITD